MIDDSLVLQQLVKKHDELLKTDAYHNGDRLCDEVAFHSSDAFHRHVNRAGLQRQNWDMDAAGTARVKLQMRRVNNATKY